VDGENREDGGLGRRASSSERIVSGGARGGSWRTVAALIVALLAVGVVLTRDGGDESADDGAGGDELDGAEMEVTDVPDVSTAYAEAAVRLGRAGTFAFQGTVRSEAATPLRPGPRIADEVTVEGAVHLPLSITTEVAVGPDGAAVETVTSGAAVWARRATDEAGLAEAPWTVVREDLVPVLERGPMETPLSRLGLALMANVVRSAGNRRQAPADEEGRQVLRSTMPVDRVPQGDRSLDIEDVVAGAELVVVLDDAGDVAHIELTNPPGTPTLEVVLDIRRLGESDVIHPDDIAEPIGATFPQEVLGEVGLGSLDLPGLPATWALTGATAYSTDSSVGSVPAGRELPLLRLRYNDLTAVGEGELTLTIWRDGRKPDPGPAIGTAPRERVEVTAGRFSGTAEPSSSLGYGEVTDGTTALSFATDLPLEASSAAIASLVPAATEPPG
jgi:hypothetical protein